MNEGRKMEEKKGKNNSSGTTERCSREDRKGDAAEHRGASVKPKITRPIMECKVAESKVLPPAHQEHPRSVLFSSLLNLSLILLLVADCGVNTSGLIFDPDASTTMSFVDLDEKGRPSYSFIRKPGADTQLKLTELPLNMLRETSVLHISGLALSDEPIRGAVAMAIQQAADNKKLICLDPNYREDIWKSEAEFKARTLNAMNSVDIVIMNLKEMQLLSDTDDPETSCKLFLKRGIKIVIILSSEDTYVYTHEGAMNVRTFPTAAVDTTGAGGVFVGTFLASFIHLPQLLESTLVTLKDIVQLAGAASALSTRRRGGTPSIPSLTEINALLMGETADLP